MTLKEAYDNRRKANDLWKTPIKTYEDLDKEFHFDFDPCPMNADFDGLKCDWGKVNFVNPPYSGNNIWNWLIKGLIESAKGKTSVYLLPSRTGTKWFHEIVLCHELEVRFLRGRIKFSGRIWNAPFDSIVVIINPRMWGSRFSIEAAEKLK